MHRPGFATGRHATLHRRDQAVGQLAFSLFEGADHGLDHRRACEHVAGRHALLAGHRVMVAQGLRAAEVRGAAEVVDGGDLPVLAVAVAGQHLVQGLGRCKALLHQGQGFRAQGGQGDVLRRDGTHTGQ
ncbi:hypothetical protein D3C73_1232310 [compost metagenome]